MQRGVHCRLMDNSTSVREAAVELLGRFVLSRPQLIEQYYDMLIERILVIFPLHALQVVFQQKCTKSMKRVAPFKIFFHLLPPKGQKKNCNHFTVEQLGTHISIFMLCYIMYLSLWSTFKILFNKKKYRIYFTSISY